MTKTTCFDAALEFISRKQGGPLRILLSLEEMSVSAILHFYKERADPQERFTFVQIHTAQPLSLSWKDEFVAKSPDGSELWGRGTVLDPVGEKIIRSRIKRRLEYLRSLLGDVKAMLLAVAQYKGIHGVHGKEIIRFGHHSQSSLLELCQELETEGLIRIIEFSPLFLISQESIVFLCEKILRFLAQFHEKYPSDVGAQREKIRSRFGANFRILNLALKYLKQKGEIKETGDYVALSSFEMTLLPDEEKIMDLMEKMYLKDKFQSVSLDDLQTSLGLSSRNLHKMLTLLIERKKIVLGKDGFILHSRWLEEIVHKVRSSGKRELTVSEFKELTGLTRKYAIPLLELLDQMRVTRRRGAIREIL